MFHHCITFSITASYAIDDIGEGTREVSVIILNLLGADISPTFLMKDRFLRVSCAINDIGEGTREVIGDPNGSFRSLHFSLRYEWKTGF